MKRVFITILLCCPLFFGGCETPMGGAQIASNEKGEIYQGQSADSVENVLGAPDVVSSGSYCKNFWAGGAFFVPGIRTIEWVYLDFKPNTSLIIWMDQGHVARIGQAPTDKIRY